MTRLHRLLGFLCLGLALAGCSKASSSDRAEAPAQPAKSAADAASPQKESVSELRSPSAPPSPAPDSKWNPAEAVRQSEMLGELTKKFEAEELSCATGAPRAEEICRLAERICSLGGVEGQTPKIASTVSGTPAAQPASSLGESECEAARASCKRVRGVLAERCGVQPER